MTYVPLLRHALAHEQTPRTCTFFYRHRHKPRQRYKRVTVPAVPSVHQLASADNLIATYYAMRSQAGQARGRTASATPTGRPAKWPPSCGK